MIFVGQYDYSRLASSYHSACFDIAYTYYGKYNSKKTHYA